MPATGKNRKSQKGQAFAELVICLIPLVFVFAGLILAAVLGRGNLQCTIGARSEADLLRIHGRLSGGEKPQVIRFWDYGDDKVPMTNDDVAETMADYGLSSDSFEMNQNTYISLPASPQITDFKQNGYLVCEGPFSSEFTDAADLTGKVFELSDYVSENRIAPFTRMFNLYLHEGKMPAVKDTVFFPATK